MRLFNVPVVVAINSFPTDTPAEVEAVKAVSLAAGARDAVVADHWAKGGEGAADLASAVWAAAEEGAPGLQAALPGRRVADREDRGDRDPGLRRRRRRPERRPAAKQLAQYESLGFGKLPICMAKSQYSLSHDAALKGRPTGFRLPIREVRLSAGAGFVTPLAGEMRTMPGPAVAGPAARTSTSTPRATSSGSSSPTREPRASRVSAERLDQGEDDHEAENDADGAPRPSAERRSDPSRRAPPCAWSSCPLSSP